MIEKACSTLTIEKDHILQSIIPLIINQQRGQTKIFQVYFWSHCVLIDTVVSKIFEDNQITTPLPSSPTRTSLDPMTPDPKQLITK